MIRIGMPGWHLSVRDLFADRFGPRAHILVAQRRKRRDLTRSMAFGATLEKYRRDVFGERDVLRRRFVVAVGVCRRQVKKTNYRKVDCDYRDHHYFFHFSSPRAGIELLIFFARIV